MAEIISDVECPFEEPLVLDTPAPNFVGEAYYQGDRVNIELYELLKNSWVVLFFYAADFTFV